MAGNQLSPPAPFPAIRGDPPVPWHRWFQSFHTYLVAYGLDDKSVSDIRRREILLHCRSTEGQRVFSSFNASSDSHEESTATLYRHFGPKHSIIMSRYKFRQRSQQAGESVIQFVAALRELSTLCNFGGLCEEMIRDKLIEKTSVNRIRERQPLEPDSLTVDLHSKWSEVSCNSSVTSGTITNCSPAGDYQKLSLLTMDPDSHLSSSLNSYAVKVSNIALRLSTILKATVV